MILLGLMLATMNLYFGQNRPRTTRPDKLRPPVPIPAAYKETLIGLLSNFSTLAHWHRLEYWMCAGTLLGDVRDVGLIPWDNDGDLCVPRGEHLPLAFAPRSGCRTTCSTVGTERPETVDFSGGDMLGTMPVPGHFV